MLGTGAVARWLGFAVAATILLAVVASTAFAQSLATQAQQPAAENPAETKPTTLSLFDHQRTKPKSALESWLSGVEMKCIGCGLFGTTTVRPESTNANAPWVMQGTWRRGTPFGMVSTGFVGVRNYALPLSTAMPLGGGFDPSALGYARTDTFAPSSQWSMTASIEKTLKTFKNGATIGIAADMMMPVSTQSLGGGDPRISTSSTFRFGFVIRW